MKNITQSADEHLIEVAHQQTDLLERPVSTMVCELCWKQAAGGRDHENHA